MAALVSLPALCEFGLRAKGLELTSERIKPLLRSKLVRIVLVDVTVSGHDLAALADLPPLRGLSLVLSMSDDDLDSLTRLRGLRRLMIGNDQVSPAAARALREALRQCELDWGEDARLFDTARAFDR